LRLAEALNIIRAPAPNGVAFPVLLAAGFTPLHLKSFFHAHLQQALPDRPVTVSEGLYGDLCGALERAAATPLHGIAVALEWPDLDPRLSYRSACRWSVSMGQDIILTASEALERIAAALENIPADVRMTLSLPGLPLPPFFPASERQASAAEIALSDRLSSFCARVSRRPDLFVVNPFRLAVESPPAGRFDLQSDLVLGFPYTVSHASALAASHALLMAPRQPRKGIITDLDDTLWDGVAGEVGPDAVSWDLSRHHHLHALYQNLLLSLSEQGVLVGVASKNDPAIVERCFARADILLRAEKVFPFEVHWGAKSRSVARILQTWNIAADSVIFVDDSPMELAEVAAAHPGMECLRFPKGDYAAGLDLLWRIRDLCGKPAISPDDVLRLASLRQGAEFRRLSQDAVTPDEFLRQAQAAISCHFGPGAGDARALELVNKTNQFNLNGARRTEADWRCLLQQPDGVLAVLGYEDRFGPLGKISVIQGQRRDNVLHVNTWVMSCRAFSRRIEYQCLHVLFERLGVETMLFDFTPTAKNRPLQEFFETLLGFMPEGPLTLSRREFAARCPALFHAVSEHWES